MRHKTLLLISSLILATSLFIQAPSASAAPPVVSKNAAPIFEPSACPFDVPMGLVEGRDLECGYLVVPEDHANPSGPSIRLAVAIIKSRETEKKADPLVVAQGGPGGSTIDTYLEILPTSRLLSNRDIILFDQRGTLNSEPALMCEEHDQLMLDTLEVDMSLDEYDKLSLQATKACHDRLVKEGVNLSAFNSLQNAADVNALREALGYEQINLYGVSYGTLLALHTMRDYPQGLRSVILDAVVPTQINYLTRTGQTSQRSFTRLFEACAADPSCNEAYPDLEQTFFNLVNELNNSPARIPMTDPDSGLTYDVVIDGDSFMGAIFQLLYSGGLVPSLPRMIYDAKESDFDAFGRVMTMVLFDRSMSYGMFYSVLCAEDADFDLQDQQLEGVHPELARLEKRSLPVFLETCKIWNVSQLGPEVDQPVTSPIPTLVLSGEFDPITPPEYAAEAAAGLPNSYSLTFPSGSHGAALNGKCEDQIILDFLDDPSQAPDSSCIAGKESVEFFTPSAVIEMPVIIKLVNLEGTSAIELLLLVLPLLFLLTGLLVVPLVWLINLILRKKQLAGGGVDHQAARPPLVVRIAGWAAMLNALLLFIFLVGLLVEIFILALNYDNRLLYGVSGQANWLFVLPLLALVLTGLMLAAAVLAWLKRVWNIWYRIYYTLLALSAVGCLIILTKWQVFSAFI